MRESNGHYIWCHWFMNRVCNSHCFEQQEVKDEQTDQV